jgi:mannosidase alpha-like ER degradation enhancer 1
MKPTAPSYVDSLSAFFPGVMVLAGDIESAIRGHLVFWNIWRKYDAIPESWDSTSRGVGWGGWPGRPEFIESTYYLHRVSSGESRQQ